MDQGVLTLRSEPIRDHPEAVRVILEGSIDPKTVNRFRDEIQAIFAKGATKFFLDCAKLTYVNSSGLAFMLNLAGMVKPKNGAVALAALDPKILVIFKMMGIVQLFQFHPSYADALKDLDEKLAKELRDVGPALQLEEPPKPVVAPKPVTPRPSAALVESTRRMRTMSAPPPANPIVRFFRALFGIEDEMRPAFFSRLSRRRR